MQPHLDGANGRAAAGQHGVEQEHMQLVDVRGQLAVEEMGGFLRATLVALDQDLADSNALQHVSGGRQRSAENKGARLRALHHGDRNLS